MDELPSAMRRPDMATLIKDTPPEVLAEIQGKVGEKKLEPFMFNSKTFLMKKTNRDLIRKNFLRDIPPLERKSILVLLFNFIVYFPFIIFIKV